MTSCRACGSSELERVLDLGAVPAADHFPPVDEQLGDDESCHPLAMDLCVDCGLAQLADDDTVTDEPRGIEPQALKDQATEAVRQVADSDWLRGTTVTEFGSPHGGTWLPLLIDRGFATAADGVPADVVLDCFGIMHEPDQLAAFRRRAAATAPDGVLLLQYHSLGSIVAQGQWNALRHGHFAYYTLTSIRRAIEQAGMRVHTAWEFDLYGGTVLLAASRQSDAPDESVSRILAAEHKAGLTRPDVVRTLQDEASKQTTQLRRWLEHERSTGHRVFAYGAASRAVALFAMAGIDRSLVAGVADASPAKQGRRMPGTDVPIVSPETLVAAEPHRVLLTLPDLLNEVDRAYPSVRGRWVTEPGRGSDEPVSERRRDTIVEQGAARAHDSERRSFARSIELQNRLHHLVPGGAHTYARGSDQYPECMAPILSRGAGARVWDVDGNEYVEYGMGLRSVTLGHGHPRVVEAVKNAIVDGTNFSRPTELEVLAAEEFLALLPAADMVKFAKNGSDVTTAAVRLARAATGRDLVATCNHPFFSVDDWFIGTTDMNAGIPDDVTAKTLRFRFNDIDSLRELFANNPNGIACVIMEAATATAEPSEGFLQAVRALCDEHGALLIFDEMITGFRWSEHGAQGVYGVAPDLSCWGKAMGNGFPISALAGKRQYMELGGLATDADRVFLLSTTHGPETSGLAALRAVLSVYASENPVGDMAAAGTALGAGVTALVQQRGLSDFVQVVGRATCSVFVTRDPEGAPSQAFRTLFMQGLLDNGVLGQSFVVSAAHTPRDIDRTLAAVDSALVSYRDAIDAGTVDGFLRGRPVAPALRKRAHPRRL